MKGANAPSKNRPALGRSGRQGAKALHSFGLDLLLRIALSNESGQLRFERKALVLREETPCKLRAQFTNAATKTRHSQLLHNIATLLPIAQDLGIVLALENPGHGEGALLQRGADGAQLVRAIGSPYLRLNYDVANIVTYNFGAVLPEDDLGAGLPHAAHAHLKDIAGDGEGWRFTAIGDGAINYRAVLQTIRTEFLSLPLAIELPLRLARPGFGPPVRCSEVVPIARIREAIARSLAFTRKALAPAPGDAL